MFRDIAKVWLLVIASHQVGGTWPSVSKIHLGGPCSRLRSGWSGLCKNLNVPPVEVVYVPKRLSIKTNSRDRTVTTPNPPTDSVCRAIDGFSTIAVPATTTAVVPESSQMWPLDCNDASTSRALVGLADRQQASKRYDIDFIRCSSCQCMAFESFTSSLIDIDTPNSFECETGRVMTALWDSDAEYEHVSQVKCALLDDSRAALDLAGCVFVQLHPDYRLDEAELMAPHWPGQCPSDSCYVATGISWTNSGWNQLKCCPLV